MELTKSQKSVINIKDKNMLVSASAGSGKTFVVIQRILDKIIKDRGMNLCVKLKKVTF